MSKLNARFKFHLSENELAKLDADVAKAGLSRSEYLRSMLREMKPIPFPKPDLQPYLREINELGLVINQLAVNAHKKSFIDLNEVTSCMRKVEKLIDEFFSLYADYRAEKENCHEKSILRPEGAKREIDIRLTWQDKAMFDLFSEQTKLTKITYLKKLMEGIQPRELPPHEFYKFQNEVLHIDINVSKIYMRSITLNLPSQDILCEYSNYLQKKNAELVHIVF